MENLNEVYRTEIEENESHQSAMRAALAWAAENGACEHWTKDNDDGVVDFYDFTQEETTPSFQCVSDDVFNQIVLIMTNAQWRNNPAS